jgi:hypothetical protein
MGESHNDPLRVDFERQIKLEFHGSTVTSDAGLLTYRELDNTLGLTSMAASGLDDARTGQNTQHSLLALRRQSIYSRLAGRVWEPDPRRSILATRLVLYCAAGHRRCQMRRGIRNAPHAPPECSSITT